MAAPVLPERVGRFAISRLCVSEAILALLLEAWEYNAACCLLPEAQFTRSRTQTEDISRPLKCVHLRCFCIGCKGR